MDVEHIFRKPGTEWTDEEKAAVFEWLMHEMLDDLIHFAYGFTHTYRDSLERAKDIVQTKIADVFRYLRTYDPERYRKKEEEGKSPFLNWLYHLIAREAVRRFKRDKRRQEWLQQQQERHQKQLRQEERRKKRLQQQIMPLLVSEIGWEKLLSYIAQLPPKYKQAVELCDFQGMTRAEAAEVAGCLEGAMKVRLHRAHQELWRLCQEHVNTTTPLQERR